MKNAKPSALAVNKKALFDYEVLEKYQAGLVLSGQEVKSAKKGQIALKGAYITFHNNEAFVLNMHISKYGPAGPLPDYDPTATRKILLRKKEIVYLQAKTAEKGLTIVPLKVYTNDRLVKIEIALVKGKKDFDKRDSIKKRETDREIDRMKKML